MPATLVEPPYLAFLDSAGKPLENGYIYVGQPGFEAQSTPKPAYFDPALTIPTPGVIRTTGGYPMRNGSPTRFFVDGDYSITVLDKNGVRVFAVLSQVFSTVGLFPDGTLAAAGFGFELESNSGFIRPAAGVVQQTILGAAVAEASASQYRFAIPVTQTTQAALVAGTNAQGQGPMTADLVLIATAAANPSGATLPAGILGRQIGVTNNGANPVNVYPASGGTINALAINTPILLPVGSTMTFIAFSTTAWRAIPSVPTLVAAKFLRANVAGTALEFAGDDFEQFSSDALPAAATFDKTGLGIFRDVLVMVSQASTSAASVRQIKVGNSGGVLSTSIYQAATTALVSRFDMSDSSSFVRSYNLLIRNFNTTMARKFCSGSTNLTAEAPVMVVEPTAFDRIQLALSGAATFTGGQCDIYGRR